MKAGALGLLTLVALWFWAPLVWGWIRPTDSTTTDAPAAAASVSAAAPAIAATPQPVNLDWQGLLRARLTDPKMSPATWNTAVRDPFREVITKAAPATPVQEEAIVAKPAAKGLQELGLVLQGVMLGTKTKSATINGVTLREGASFAIDKDGKLVRNFTTGSEEASLTFVKLREVRASEVVLVSEGKDYPLPLRKRGTETGTIEITRSSSGK